MEATAAILTLSEEQKKSIIDEIVKSLEEVIEDPVAMAGGPYEEDEYKSGKETFSGDLEDFEISELPGFSNDADIYICGEYRCSYRWYDDYDRGDYWTPESGGLEVYDCKVSVKDFRMEISEWDDKSEMYITFGISEEGKREIISEINQRVA